MPFWRIVDQATFAKWNSFLEPHGWLLDIRCADGRSAFPFVDRYYVIGFDISAKMIRRAVERARLLECSDRTAFFVADACNIPFRDESFDRFLTYGALHHVPDPGAVVRDIQRILNDRGLHLGSENNKSILRPIFDGLMRLLPLWTEEAGEEPLLSKKMLHDWTSGLPLTITSRTSVFLPPHLYSLMGEKVGKLVFKVAEATLAITPGLRANGGLLVFEIRKGTAIAGNGRPRSQHRRH